MEGEGVQAQYGAQVAADLQGNVQDQERVGAELAALEDRLRALRKDHALLLQVQRALGTAGSTAGAPEEAAEPEVEEAGEVPKPRRTSAEENAATQNTSPAGDPEEGGHEGGTSSSVGVKATKPTLVTLVRDQLTQQAEPRSAAEITAALIRAYPDRSIKATVVRTTVEGLVAKGRARRTKQGSSVFYTSADTASAQVAGVAEAAAV